ncbi:Gfo/Idh/MocA family protein [Sphingosinithalassobacter sp. CS137]|uniref:Gfo/Idh/MocA family protein n=1 Tax=Sphingosinithalassobacter sp. CS137 TaxID=2762748 RepID=UPI00165D57B2|nr:Gfo/Idh/MocA family oxidoreductase [Sphingosinithalassobacter sp. CS137]
MKPRIGFLGTGWIGRHRMEAMLESAAIEAIGIADPSPEMAQQAAQLAPHAQVVDGLAALLALEPDGIAIATPSALHADQSIAALERGLAVFCQKPLGRTAGEAKAVVEAARTADRLLAVDFSYRYTEGMRRIAELVRGGDLGRLYAADLVFHNAYGPDKPWFYDAAQSGGGCVMDLGVHLVDLALWLFGEDVSEVSSRLYAKGDPLKPGDARVEDYAVAQLTLAGGASVRLACSWRLDAGQDAVIAADFHGTEGGAALRNVNGSFYDFTAEHFRGTAREMLASPPDAWGGRAAVDWAQRLVAGERFDPTAQELVRVAAVLDRIYGR